LFNRLAHKNADRFNGINPWTFLEYVFAHIADHKVNRIGQPLPWNMDGTPTATA
jgi:hypothetical protein